MRRLVNKGYAWLESNPVTGLFVAGGLSGLAVLGVVGTLIYTQETFVAKTACTRDPTSAACAKIREEIARAEPIRNPCISYQRVTATRGRNCPKDFTGHRAHQDRPSSATGAELGGDAPQPADEAGQKPSPAPAGGKGGTKPPEGDEGGGEPTHGPHGAPETPAAPATGSPAGEGSPSNEPAAEVDQEAPQETEQVKPGLIGNPGGVVGEVVCSVNALGIRVCTE